MSSIKLISKPRNIVFVDYYYEFDSCAHFKEIFKKKGMSYFKFKDFFVSAELDKDVFFLQVSDKKYKKNKDLRKFFDQFECGCGESDSSSDSDSSDSDTD